MYLLDTNTVIYFFKGMGQVAHRLLATPPSEVAISSITLFELQVGVAKSKASKTRLAQLAEFTALIRCIDFTALEAAAAAQLRVQLEAAGRPIGPLDNLLAGTALAHGTVFVTRNVREFARVKGLTVESWY
jgi:tRNA(fMet)-specific endonuclease VapC